MVYLIILIVGIILSETSGFNLNCTNDYETSMSCHINARNCTELRMTLRDTKKPRKTCAFEPCVGGCCCKMEMKVTELITGRKFTAEVYENGQTVHNQIIDIYKTIKPKTPTIISVDKLNVLYRIKWRTNAFSFARDDLSAIVTYHKKGDDRKNTITVKVSTIEDMNNCDIPGRDLEPNTAYVVSVITYTNSNVFSDSSQEVEFTTDSSQNGLFIAAVISLCVIAIAVSGVSFASFIKLKDKLWDKAATAEKPKLLNIKHKKEVILTPELLSVYSLSVEPLISRDNLISKESLSDSSGRSGQSSGLSSASSSLDYANTQPLDSEAGVLEALQNAFPMFIPSMDTPGVREPEQKSVIPPSETTPFPVTFENKSYVSTQSSQTTCDADEQETGGHHSSDAPPLQDFMIPPHVSTNDTDMSYHPCTLSEDATNDLSPVSPKSLPVNYGLDKVEQSNNVLSEILLDGLTNTSKSSEVGHFQVGIPPVSHEMIVDCGYHCV